MPEGIYSANQLNNPSFETGDFAWWFASGIMEFPSVVNGGTDGDKCCRMLCPTSYVEQSVEFPFTPTDITIQGDFLPASDWESPVELPGWLRVRLNYSDGSRDEATIPLRDDGEATVEWV